MAVCDKCGKEVHDDAKFCKACGKGRESSLHDEKKKRVLGSEAPSRKTPAIVAAAVVVLVVGFFAFSSNESRSMAGMQSSERNSAPHAEYTKISAENGEVRIPESVLEGDRAKYFSYTGNGKTIKFFAVRAEDGAVRVALDACSACYHAKLGYRQEGGGMVCNNCGMKFRSTDVGKVSGGCSPIPVEKKIDNKLIVVKAADLEAGAKYF